MASGVVLRNDVCWVAGNARRGKFLRRTSVRTVWDDVDSLAFASLFDREDDAAFAIRRKLASCPTAKAWRLKPLRVRRRMSLSFDT